VTNAAPVPCLATLLVALLLPGCDDAPTTGAAAVAPDAPAPARPDDDAKPADAKPNDAKPADAKTLDANPDPPTAAGEPAAMAVPPPTPSVAPGDIPASFPLDEPEPSGSVDAGTALPALPTGVMAKVGTVDIPMTKFREVYDGKVKKYSDRGREIPSSADRRYRKSIAERLIHAEVIAQHAKSLGLTHDPAALAERQAQQKRGIVDWPKHLERRGETEASLREMYVTELLEVAILEHRGELDVSAAEIRDEHDKVGDAAESEAKLVERLRLRKLHAGRRALKDELLQAAKVVDHVAATLGPEPAAR
jgi:hypothetical protein